jgi:hypothetical protein
MKTFAVAVLILITMGGQLNADNHPAANNKITLNLDDTSEVLVTGFIAPIEYTGSNFHVEWDELANLRVAEPEKQYQASVFRAFLPDKSVSIGDLWRIEEEGALELLKQLHPNPNLKMHINMGDSRGLWACLRAYNDQYADIVLRIHAEFVLENGWFTPSQFTGHLVIDRVNARVAFFVMHVPGGPVNFDFNRIINGSRVAGAGFCSQVELRAGTQEVLENVEFTEAITQEAAERALILRFYKSQQINWVQPDQVLEMAHTQQKPIHAISIDGPLDNESC